MSGQRLSWYRPPVPRTLAVLCQDVVVQQVAPYLLTRAVHVDGIIEQRLGVLERVFSSPSSTSCNVGGKHGGSDHRHADDWWKWYL